MKVLLATTWLTLASLAGFFLFGTLFWKLYPYPDQATREVVVSVWLVHVTVEKYLAFLISTAISALVVWKARPRTYLSSVDVGVLAGLPFHLLAGAIYIYRFGWVAYVDNSRPLEFFPIVILLSATAAVLVHAFRPNDAQQGAPADGPASRARG